MVNVGVISVQVGGVWRGSRVVRLEELKRASSRREAGIVSVRAGRIAQKRSDSSNRNSPDEKSASTARYRNCPDTLLVHGREQGVHVFSVEQQRGKCVDRRLILDKKGLYNFLTCVLYASKSVCVELLLS